MVQLLALADEILLQIILHLRSPLRDATNDPCEYWPRILNRKLADLYLDSEPFLNELAETYSDLYDYFEEIEDKYLDSETVFKGVKPLLHTCRRFYRVFLPVYYAEIDLIPNGPKCIPLLYRSLVEAPFLGEHIKEFSVMDVNLSDIYTFFFLPNIRKITIGRFEPGAVQRQSFPNAQIGTSPVTILRLFNIGADMQTLTEVLSWPKALKELWYHATWEGFSGWPALEYPQTPAVEMDSRLSTQGIAWAMKPHAQSLETLVFTHTNPITSWGVSIEAINLSTFTKIKDLRIAQGFLTGERTPGNEWSIRQNMPASLETLEVWYDEYWMTAFCVPPRMLGTVRNEWLISFCDGKNTGRFLGNLKRIRILSEEGQGKRLKYFQSLIQDLLVVLDMAGVNLEFNSGYAGRWSWNRLQKDEKWTDEYC